MHSMTCFPPSFYFADGRLTQGTRDFMAVEVQNMAYRFRPPQADVPEDSSQGKRDFHFWEPTDDDDDDDDEIQQNIPMESRPKTTPNIPWFYNPIHDMESIMWLSNYFTIGKNIEFPTTSTTSPTTIKYYRQTINLEAQNDREKRILRQDNYSSNLFYQTGYREDVLNSLSGWDKLIHPVLVEVGVLRILNTVRARLVARYRDVEKDISVSTQILAGPKLYQGMIDDFSDACRRSERLIPRAVTTDLAREANELRAKAALPVAQLQTMSLQDGALPETDTNRGTEDAGPSQQQTQPVGLGATNPTPPGRHQDTNQAHPPADSPKTVKPTKKQRKHTAPAVPTRIQPPRQAHSRG